MGVKANFTMKDVQGQMAGYTASLVSSAVQAVSYLGVKCVNYARSIPDPEHGGNGFKDQTGNLRSSIGFKVFVDGQPMAEDYRQVLGGKEGMERGMALADDVGRRCPRGQIMLVVTAGMEYAVFVESKGRDVIASSELLARQEWPKMKERIDEMMKRK